jgi:anti-sigma regulatory factor (Ser/Thr protein kinase)
VSTATATTYQGTFHGRAEEAARVRREIAGFLGDCPAAEDIVLIAHELAANAIVHSRSRGGRFAVRCELAPGSARVEIQDTGGPWRTRTDDDRPHGLDIVQALTGPDGWGTKGTPDDNRIVWAALQWTRCTKDVAT